ncbi:hypothetical protein NCR96_02870 [Helicobacter sp. 14348-15]|uniref:coiled-coil domain-containing protein n=1 Tax=Helicobacter colisuis TaxID=2949739 RepID=UPI00202B4FEA|nr:hypothetical protein [Helicobacter colisuis]MCL9820692.1 hypothetical protein [Helicobacter colisuis]
MTAYVHIGTVKTGTTSIQTFLVKNRELLRKQKYFHPHYCSGIENWKLFHLAKATQEVKQERFEGFRQSLLKRLVDEVIIFSSECFHEFFYNQTEIFEFKKVLLSLGFNKVFIVIYLREPFELVTSFYNTELLLRRKERYELFEKWENAIQYGLHIADHRKSLQNWEEIFGKENLIVRLFDKNEFKDGDLLKDFVDAIGLKWDDSFIIPEKENETIDLLGIKLTRAINYAMPHWFFKIFLQKHFTLKDKDLKFMPPKEVYQSYIDYFEESNEWVKKEFFPHKERLFPKKDLTNYKENYELKEMKPEYWDRIAEFIADIVKTKNQAIVDKTTIIQNKDKLIAQKDQIIQTKNQELTSKNQELESKTQQLTQTKNQLDSTKNQLDTTQKELDSKVKQMDSQIKNLESSQNQSNLKIQKLTEANQQLDLKNQELSLKNQQLNSKTKELNFTLRYGTAKDRIHNHLSYKLGQAMIENSKSLLGYIRMPYVLSYIKDKHKQEQQQYQEAIKKNPNLKLPNLESYPDYKESLKEKECLTYKLGEAFIKANKTWYKGGYVKLWFEVRRLRGERK